jgi:hypothetical protein
MTFPTIPTGGRVLTNVQANTTATRTFPNLSGLTKSSGDLLIAICIVYQSSASGGAVFSGWSAGWTEFGDLGGTTSNMSIGMAYKWSTGSETGTIAVTQAATITGAATMMLLSIPGAHATTPPEHTAIANDTSSAANPAALVPSWGVDDTLWIAVGGSGRTSTSGTFTGLTAAPTNYSNLASTGSSGGGIVGDTWGAAAFRQNNTASEDVATFTCDTINARNSAVVIAVRPVQKSEFKNSCTGTNAATVTTANTGGPDQFAEANVSGAGSSLAFSNSHAFNGKATSIHAVGGASVAYCAWHVAPTDGYSDAYIYMASPPTALARIMAWDDNSTFTMCCGAYVDTSGHIVVLDSTFTGLATSTTVITGADVRLEFDFVGNATTGSFSLKIYTNPESGTPAETLSGTNVNTHGAADQFWIGASDFGSTGSDLYFGDVAVSAIGAIPPVLVTGTGSVRMHKMGLSGTGHEKLVATGSVRMHKMGLSGTGHEKLVATGSVRMHKMGLAGSGTVSSMVTGTGSVRMHKMGLSGSGIAYIGSGSVRMHKMGIAITGVLHAPDLWNNFSGLTNGTTLTTGNTGGVSGRKFDSITIPSGATLAADNTHLGLDAMALKVATTTTTGVVTATWSLAASLSYTRTKMYFRADCLKTAAATPTLRPFAFRNAAGVHVFSPLVTGNTVQFSTGSGFVGSGNIFTGSIANNQYFRIEGYIDTVAGTAHMELYLNQTDAVPSQVADVSGLSFGDVIGSISVGNNNSATSDGPFWIDVVGFSENGPLSPASVRMHKMGLSGSGYEKITGTGSVRMHKMGISATGHAPLFGSGSIAMHKMGLSGSGFEKLTATGSVRMHKMGLSGIASAPLFGSGSIAMHKMGLSGSGFEKLSGTGSVRMHKMGLSGIATAPLYGTGSVSMHKMGLSGTSEVTVPGTGSVAMHKMGLSGTGTAPLLGSGSVAMHKMGLSGTGQEIVSGTGSIAMHKMSLSGTGTAPLLGTGSIAMHKMGLDGFGTVGSIIAGFGSVRMNKMGLSGTGTAPLLGSGSVRMHKMGLSGSGVAELTATGSVRMHKMGLSGTGHEKLTATGSVRMHKMSLSGSGFVPSVSGSGSVALHKMSLSGSGIEIIRSTGSVRMHKMGLSGSGHLIVSGTGSVSMHKMRLHGQQGRMKASNLFIFTPV